MADLHELETLFKEKWSEETPLLRNAITNRCILKDTFEPEEGSGADFWVGAVGVPDDIDDDTTGPPSEITKAEDVPNTSKFYDKAAVDQTLEEYLKTETPDSKYKEQATLSVAQFVEASKHIALQPGLLKNLDHTSSFMKFLKTKIKKKEDFLCLRALTATMTRKPSGSRTTTQVALPDTSKLNVAIGLGKFNVDVYARVREHFGDFVAEGERLIMLINWAEWTELVLTNKELLGSFDFRASPDTDRFVRTGTIPELFGIDTMIHAKIPANKAICYTPDAMRWVDYGLNYDTLDRIPIKRNMMLAQMGHHVDALRIDDAGVREVTITAAA